MMMILLVSFERVLFIRPLLLLLLLFRGWNAEYDSNQVAWLGKMRKYLSGIKGWLMASAFTKKKTFSNAFFC